jgi:transcriptional regulator with XRE-family HTH domain
MTDGERDPAEFGPWPLGTRLKDLRTAARLSLRAVAKAAGTTAATVDAMEKGYRVGHGGGIVAARNPDANNVIRVAEAVGLNASEALRLAGHLAPAEIPTSRPTIGVRALAENIALLPAGFRRHIAAIVEEHLRATGHLPPAADDRHLPTTGPLGEILSGEDETGPAREADWPRPASEPN